MKTPHEWDDEAPEVDGPTMRDFVFRIQRDAREELLGRIADLDAHVASLKQDQEDWRKGVALIASALGEHNPKNLCCVRLANKALEMRAAVERTAPKEGA